jgi:hypothetical protein
MNKVYKDESFVLDKERYKKAQRLRRGWPAELVSKDIVLYIRKRYDLGVKCHQIQDEIAKLFDAVLTYNYILSIAKRESRTDID